jgi:hypothetical protein
MIVAWWFSMLFGVYGFFFGVQEFGALGCAASFNWQAFSALRFEVVIGLKKKRG